MANFGRLPLLPGQYGVHIWPDDTLIYLARFPHAWKFFKRLRKECGIAIFRRQQNGMQDTELVYKNDRYPFTKLHV